jgi:hypothetical protein
MPTGIQQEGTAMVDRNALGIIGAIFTAAALTVTAIACWVVSDHVQGRLVLDMDAQARHAVLR